jgi:hypothetical protein
MKTIERLPLRHQGIIESFMITTVGELPTESDVRVYLPAMSDFMDPESAMHKKAPHGVSHITRLLIMGARVIDKQTMSHPMLALPVQGMMEALSIHDCGVIDSEENDHHGADVITWFEKTGKSLRYGSRWEMIKFFVTRHSDKPGSENGFLRMQPLRMRVALETIQDIDASDLTRPGVGVHKDKIVLRTDLAKYYELPTIAEILRTTAEGIHTGNPVEDQIEAAVQLGLLLRAPIKN